ncbi:MAG: group II intron maturase-specific domain-containing protein [Bryobacteraceae bacterium]
MSRGKEKLRDRVRALTGKRQSGKDVKQIVAELTAVFRGWGNYFRTGNADREFNKMDGFVFRSLRRWQSMGTVKYPAQVSPGRLSVSRVPENGTHGLKGDSMGTGWR